MTNTPNLSLPYIVAAQAQKHVTHNEALRALDAVVQLAVLDRGLATPPVSPTEGDQYIIASGATGAWSGKDAQIAAWQDGAWMFYTPREGWLAWVADEDTLFAWDGSAWSGVSGASSETALKFGVNTTADNTNRLSVKSDAALFSHDDITPGSGDVRAILNKSAAANTASFLFQDNFSGRAEIGLTGDDDFHFKVSPDGTSFSEAILIDRTAGSVTFPLTADIGYSYLINGDFSLNQRGFSGGALAAGAYGYDRWKADTGGATVSVSGDTITLTSGTIVQVIEAGIWRGVLNFANDVLTLSVGDLTSGDLDIDIEDQTGTITAASGRAGASITVPGASTGNITVKLTPASGAVTFNQMKLEQGSTATAWTQRPLEALLAKRYYLRYSVSSGNIFLLNAQTFGTNQAGGPLRWPTEMRGTPTIAGSAASNFFATNPTGGARAAGALLFNNISKYSTNVQLNSVSPADLAAAGGAANVFIGSGGWLEADAEL